MQVQNRKRSLIELAPRSSKWSKASEGVGQLLYDKVSFVDMDGRLLIRIGKSLSGIMGNQMSPMDLMLKEDLLDTFCEKGKKVEAFDFQVTQLVKIFGHHNSRANVLEIGAVEPVPQLCSEHSEEVTRELISTFVIIRLQISLPDILTRRASNSMLGEILLATTSLTLKRALQSSRLRKAALIL